MKPLRDKVALVAGATRGAGRGIARMLGEAGATVYCSGRSSRTRPNDSSHHHAGRPETIEETADLVTAAGGTGIPVRADHLLESEVADLFRRIEAESGRLDVLVNLLTGAPVASWQPFTQLALAEGRAYFDGWIWSHITTCWYASRIMLRQRSGLMVEVVEQEGIAYHGQFYFDLMEIALKRLSHSLAYELQQEGVAALAIAPGFMRTEAILEGYGVKEENWRDALSNPDAQTFGWGGSETPCYIGRAVAALAADPNVSLRSGGIFSTRQLAAEYGFVDINGEAPDVKVLDDAVAAFVSVHSRHTPFEWRVRTSRDAPPLL